MSNLKKTARNVWLRFKKESGHSVAVLRKKVRELKIHSRFKKLLSIFAHFHFFSLGSFSLKEQIFFAKRLAFLTKAGIPLVESLHMILEQTRSRKHVSIIHAITRDVSRGQSLSVSLAKFQNIFGDFAINVIHVGETSGILSDNLEYLADELNNKHILRRKIIGALIYPAVVTTATIGIVVFLMVYLFPKIMPVFGSLNMQLPWSTKAAIFISNFLRQEGLQIFLVLIFLSIISILAFRKIQKIHLGVDLCVLRLPMIGRIIREYNIAHFGRTLGLLLKSGLPLSEALPIAAQTTENRAYRQEMGVLLKVVNRGEKISIRLKKQRRLFPEIFGQIVSVGEKSGNLSDSLIYVSELCAGEVEDFTKNLSNLIEPALMVSMGVLVGFIAISIITPIYAITQNLHA